MKAAVFYGKGKPLKFEEVPVPEIEPDEILVKVAGCGICQSDMEYIDLGVPTMKKPPLILGHESAGIVSEVGKLVTNVKAGDPVLLGNIISCGVCLNCREGRDNICDNWQMLGNHINGAYAEYIKVPAKNAYLLPPEIRPEDGCIIADAVSTPFHAVVNRSGLKPGDTALVLGCGGLGMNCIQIAAAMGARVIAVDFNIPIGTENSKTKLEMARELGASETINAKKGEKEVIKEIRSLTTRGGVDVAFEIIGRMETQREAYNSLRAGGRLVAVGFNPKDLCVSAGRMMVKELDVVGSVSCPTADMPRIINLVKNGKINIQPLITGRFPLSEVNQALDVMRKGESIRNILLP
jgi:6-hydroxycyclohex-1-ene-1-carbonyl-CoA dehydrogenase